jgi:hypothetical protein
MTLSFALLAAGPAAQYAQAETERRIAEHNANVADTKAGYAAQAGNVEAGRARAEGTKVIAEQRAALAGSGVDLSTGAGLFATTRERSEVDAQQARVNGLLQAWGYEAEAASRRMEAAAARRRSILGPLATVGNMTTGAALKIAGMGG